VYLGKMKMPEKKLSAILQIKDSDEFCVLPICTKAPFINDGGIYTYYITQCFFYKGTQIDKLNDDISKPLNIYFMTISANFGTDIKLSRILLIKNKKELYMLQLRYPNHKASLTNEFVCKSLSSKNVTELIEDIEKKYFILRYKKKNSIWKMNIYGYGKFIINLPKEKEDRLLKYLKSINSSSKKMSDDSELLGNSSNGSDPCKKP
jgi:hypothetical protein